MSDNRRVYRTIRTALKQLYSFEPQGNFARHLNTLAALIAGMVQSKSSQLPKIASHVPGAAKTESRIKRFSRWLKNERISYTSYYLPFAQELLARLAQIRTLAFTIDGSEVGRNCMTLMISLVYRKRTLPIVWLVVEQCSGQFTTARHLELLDMLQEVLPQDCQTIFLGDGEFNRVELLAALQALNWSYVCRTAKNTILTEEELSFSAHNLPLRPGDCVCIPEVAFTKHAYGPVSAIGWWKKGYTEPIYLVTNFDVAAEACYWYAKRFQIETFFSDEKSRGFYLHKSHIVDPERFARLMLAACLAYIWITYLGVAAHREKWVATLHRTDRCDWSLFRLGLALLTYFLNQDLPIPVSFNMFDAKSVR